MTGPEHYREAEELMESLANRDRDEYPGDTVTAEAQVHAILALAAATAIGGRPEEERRWMDVAGT